MNTKGCLRWGLLLGVLALVLICIAAIGLVYFQARSSALNDRPLVLIHAPINHDQVHVSDGVLVHATARADNGLRRIELWADGVFVDARDVTGDPTMLVFAGSWVPIAEGSHTLIVRAVAADGTEGQATVMVDALPQTASDSGMHTVEEGETLETIAAEEGTTPEELAAANPDLGPGGPVPGDDLIVPDDEPPAPGGGAPAEPPEGSEPPTPDDDAPGSDESLWDFPLLEPVQAYQFGAGEPIGLRVEFLNLGTVTASEALHCYIGAGDIAPRWYPDEDGDQSTDESFEQDSAGVWSLEADMSGEDALVFYWPRNRAIPISVSCVGITGGGTEALELGLWEDSIDPEYWTGVRLNGYADGADGSFDFTYRITRIGIWDSGEPLETDFDMTAPTNVHVEQSSSTLRWDYLPRPEESAIDGFRVYLNGSLQWTEPADARASTLPSEWVNPPCGISYRFDVTAYRSGASGEQESVPAAAFLEQPAEDCIREIAITFVSLETFNLGGDGDDGDRTGDIGPAYGFFYANEQQVTFSGGHLGAGLDMPNGLSHNHTYNLSEMSGDSSWRFSGEPSLVVAIPDGGAFEFGFHIDDEDSGRCDDSDDPGCDDLICEGFSMIYEEESISSDLDTHHEDSITSEDGRCRVTFEWGPAAGSPVGAGVEGAEPLPWISLEDMAVDEASGAVRLTVRNTGTAGWPGRDLNIELQSREGISLGVYTWAGFTLEAGQSVVLEDPDMRLAAPFDACVMIDPYDAVMEAYERSGAMYHNPICPQLPDLIITSANFESSGGGRIRVAVRNVGDGAVENRTIALATLLPDGSPLYMAASWPNVTLEPGATRMFDLSGVTDSVREQMRGGYSVVVNPDATIREANSGNNTMDVAASTRLWIYLYSVYAPMDYRNSVEFHITVTVASGATRRQVADWNLSDIDWSTCDSVDEECSLAFSPDVPINFSTNWFDIFGDETLTVSVTASSSRPGVPVYWDVESFSAPDWGGGPIFNSTCGYLPTREPGNHRWVLGYHGRAAWGLRFDICRENFEEP